MPWSAGSRWSARPTTLVVLAIGLWLFGTGEALLVASHLGNTPWTVLAQGVSRHSPLSIGEATLAISAIVLVGWVPLRERPGLGTIANAVVIAVAIDVMLAVLPRPSANAGRLVEVGTAIVCIGAGSGFYLTTWLGPGPRDGWMTGIAWRTGWPIAGVRLSLELVVLVAGYLLGGRVGIGTVVFALTIGYAVTGSMRLLARAAGRPAATAHPAVGLAASADLPS
ncbi:MAG TPA: hypothetical protein VFH66_08255 [Mycobacteriales bacterium]|nr:hypothetical protein [Mycobacteriales bacterium]